MRRKRHNRGRGEPLTYEMLADDAVGLIDALGLDHPAALGWGTGGEIGLVLASRHPDVLSSLAVTGATAGGPVAVPPSEELIACTASDVPPCDLLALTFTDTPQGQAGQGEFMLSYVELAPPSAAPGIAARYVDAARRYWADGPDLDAITIPVLVMAGELDELAPVANSRRIARVIGDEARLEIEAEGLDGWFIEDPARFMSLMNQFPSMQGQIQWP